MDTGAEKKPVRVTIFNQTFTVLAAGDPSELLATAASVDELMTQIAKRGGQIDAGRVGVLTCLHLADRVRALEHELSELRQRVDAKSREMASLLDGLVKR